MYLFPFLGQSALKHAGCKGIARLLYDGLRLRRVRVCGVWLETCRL